MVSSPCRVSAEGSSFRKSNLRRTIIALAPLSIQSFSGIFWIAGYATYYYQMAGFTDQGSFHLAIIQQVLSLLGNVTAVSLACDALLTV